MRPNMTILIGIKTKEKDAVFRNIELLAIAIADLKVALAKGEPLTISNAALQVIKPYDVMCQIAEIVIDPNFENSEGWRLE